MSTQVNLLRKAVKMFFLEVGNIELILFSLISIDIITKWVVM